MGVLDHMDVCKGTFASINEVPPIVIEEHYPKEFSLYAQVSFRQLIIFSLSCLLRSSLFVSFRIFFFISENTGEASVLSKSMLMGGAII